MESAKAGLPVLNYLTCRRVGTCRVLRIKSKLNSFPPRGFLRLWVQVNLSLTLAWKIPWTEEPGGLQSMGCEESDTTERLRFHFSLSCIVEGNGNPLQCSCLENPLDRGAWWAAVHGLQRVRHSWSDLAQMPTLWGRYSYYHPQFTEGKTEAQRGKLTCPGSYRK